MELRTASSAVSLNQLQSKFNEIDKRHSRDSYWKLDAGWYEKGQCITTFPIPNDKENLLEFMTLCLAQISTASKVNSEWRAKSKQVVAKASILLAGDPDAEALIAEIRSELKKPSPLAKAVIRVVILFIGVPLIPFLLFMIFSLCGIFSSN